MIKKQTTKFITNKFLMLIFRMKGNNNTNSTSNTKNTKEIRKKRIEKGKRALNIGVKPHSKGDIFSS